MSACKYCGHVSPSVVETDNPNSYGPRKIWRCSKRKNCVNRQRRRVRIENG